MGTSVRIAAGLIASSILVASAPNPDAAMSFSSCIVPELSAGYSVEVAPDGTVWTVGTHVVRFDPTTSSILSTVPVREWGFEHAIDVSFDATGCAFICGSANPVESPNLPDLALGPGGWYDACIAKVLSDGETVLWSLRVGGTSADFAAGIAVDAEGSAWVSGTTYSTDFPLLDALRSKLGGSSDAFLMRIPGDGSGVALSTYLGGTGREVAEGAAVTPDSGVLVWGTTSGPGFVPSGIAQGDPGYADDGFVVKLDGQGSSVAWTCFPGGGRATTVKDACVTPDGRIVVVGEVPADLYEYASEPGEFERGNGDIVVARLNEDGSEASDPRVFGGSGLETAAGVAVGPDGTAWVTGTTTSTDLPAISAPRPRFGFLRDVFAAAFSPDGDRPVLSTYLPGLLYEEAWDVATGPDGIAWIVGSTQSSDFPVVAPVLPAPQFNQLAFLTRLRADDPSRRPAPPTDVLVEATGPRSVDLSWEPAGEAATGISIFRGEGFGFQRVAVLPPDALGWTDSTVESGIEYCYCLQAFDETGPSATTEDATASTPASLDVRVRSRRTDSWFRFGGTRGVLALKLDPTEHVPDGLPDPRPGGLEIAFGDPSSWPFAHRYRIPPGDPGWRVRGDRFVWSYRTEAMTFLRVVYSRRSGRLFLRDYSTTGSSVMSGEVRVRVTIGEEAGVARWPRPGELR